MSNIQKTIKGLEKKVKRAFHNESSGHDIYHLKRVANLALRIQKKEGGDEEVIAVAAFLHDIHRIIGRETEKYCPSVRSLPKVKKFCQSQKITTSKIPKILQTVKLHEEYDFSKRGKTAKDIETLIVQDADNLDAIGAIGIARTFAFGGAHKIPIWTPETPIGRQYLDESEFDSSIIHHFYHKLLKLKENMNTKTATKIAEKRTRFMEDFLKEFFREWEGKD